MVAKHLQVHTYIRMYTNIYMYVRICLGNNENTGNDSGGNDDSGGSSAGAIAGGVIGAIVVVIVIVIIIIVIYYFISRRNKGNVVYKFSCDICMHKNRLMSECLYNYMHAHNTVYNKCIILNMHIYVVCMYVCSVCIMYI